MNKKLWQRQMSFGEILSEGFRLIRNNFIPILLLLLCSQIPFNLFRTFLPDVVTSERYGELNVSIVSVLISFVNFLINLFVWIGIAFIVEKSVQGELVSLREIFKLSFSRLDDVFGTSLLVSIIILGLTLLLVVPGIIWSNYYSFAVIITALRNMKAKAALQYSKKLVQGQWWRVFWIYTAIRIPIVIFNLLILLLSRQVPDIKLLYIFAPFTIFNIVGAITLVMTVILFLNTESVRDLQRQTYGKNKVRLTKRAPDGGDSPAKIALS